MYSILVVKCQQKNKKEIKEINQSLLESLSLAAFSQVDENDSILDLNDNPDTLQTLTDRNIFTNCGLQVCEVKCYQPMNKSSFVFCQLVSTSGLWTVFTNLSRKASIFLLSKYINEKLSQASVLSFTRLRFETKDCLIVQLTNKPQQTA